MADTTQEKQHLWGLGEGARELCKGNHFSIERKSPELIQKSHMAK